ncbi:hypothetical protein DFH09DRAFT_1104988 [Mycena vulgaris]|nr:hypothetical protein DFH09DRAFT_1104988 [Mycena vulgaris]
MDVGLNPLSNSERLPIILNLVHTQPVPWNFVIDCVRDALKEICGIKDLQLVTFPDWYKKLQASEACAADVKENVPGLKILEFLHRLAYSSAASADAEFGGISFSVGKIDALSPALVNFFEPYGTFRWDVGVHPGVESRNWCELKKKTSALVQTISEIT